ncbi:MAG TPA: hypothetical protein VFL83_13685 [Anaeromyxobacter sp.]|nr:hypothetical protein [Anaeromyxobacter sp.]
MSGLALGQPALLPDPTSRALAFAAVLAAHLALSLWLPPELAAGYVEGTRIGWKLLAAAACALAAWSLRRGDATRSFWILLGAAYAVLALAEPSVGAAALGEDPTPAALRAAALVAANALSVLASVALARACLAAGRELRAGWRAAGAYAAAATAAAAMSGPRFLRDASDALAGAGPERWATALGGLADAATFVLLVPVLRLALRARGGRLVWAWAFALSSLAWLLFDATRHAGGAAFAKEAFRTAACLLAALAALYRRDVAASAGDGRAVATLAPTP